MVLQGRITNNGAGLCFTGTEIFYLVNGGIYQHYVGDTKKKATILYPPNSYYKKFIGVCSIVVEKSCVTTITLIKGTVTYLNGNTFTGVFHPDNTPRFGEYNKGSLIKYIGSTEKGLYHGDGTLENLGEGKMKCKGKFVEGKFREGTLEYYPLDGNKYYAIGTFGKDCLLVYGKVSEYDVEGNCRTFEGEFDEKGELLNGTVTKGTTVTTVKYGKSVNVVEHPIPDPSLVNGRELEGVNSIGDERSQI